MMRRNSIIWAIILFLQFFSALGIFVMIETLDIESKASPYIIASLKSLKPKSWMSPLQSR